MRLIDVNGSPHVLTEHQVRMMITIGWITFLAAWMMNILNYKVHPSSVNVSPKAKMYIYRVFHIEEPKVFAYCS